MVSRTVPRPLVAILLGVLVTGLGHVYVGRWRRGAGWLATSLGTSGALAWLWPLAELADGVGLFVPLLVTSFVVSASSLADLTRLVFVRAGDARSDASDEGTVACPACSREASADLAFCQWCGTPFEA